MKLEIGLRVVRIGGGLAAFAMFSTTVTTAEPASSAPNQKLGETVDPALTPALTRAEALKLIDGARRYVAHPTATSPASTSGMPSEPVVTTPDFQMDTPPPAPREETKPEAPAAGYVWVPGHYMPVKREWRWVRGEWAVPAQPISVWIPAKYDAKEKKWAPGYWQPDATTPNEPPAPKNPPPTAPRF